MIIFNDVNIESVAPVRVVDVTVSPITLTPVSRQRPVRFGADFVRMSGGSRTITVTLALLTNDRSIRQKQLLDIAAWARTDIEGHLEIPGYDGLYLSCICTKLPEISLRKWWDGSMSLVFTTFDNPYWTSENEKTGTCGSMITVLGSAPPLMRIERTLTAQASNRTFTLGNDTMTFSRIPVGSLVVDLNRQTAEVDGTSIMQYFTYDSTFLRPQTGQITISINTNYSYSIKWRERWQ